MIARLSVFNENLHGRFDDEKDTMSYRVVKSREEVYDIVTTTFLRLKGWRELPHGLNLKTSWNLFWTWAKPELDLSKLLTFQKVNLLYRNIENLRRQFRVPVPFLPLTFNLPKEFSQFSAKFHEDQLCDQQDNIWIMKPIGKSRGRGIKLVNNIADLSYVDNIVVQKYIRNPLLLDGYKFDMRIYVLVTSIHPLEAFVYKEGFARLSTEKFSMSADSIKNTFIHLTNFAIQKNNREAAATFDGGSKISFKSLQEKLEKMSIKWSAIWEKVHDIIVKSLLACSMTMPRFPSAFELFGYDVMIDDCLNCYLIEVNSSPSL
jgi:tubulin polyglutamylase TTLL5